MKSVRRIRIGLAAWFIGTAAALFLAGNGAAPPPAPEKFSVQTKNFTLDFQVGEDGRLYQRAVGAADASQTLLRGTRVIRKRAMVGSGSRPCKSSTPTAIPQRL